MLAEIGWHHFCVIPSPAKRESRDLGFRQLDKGPPASGDHFSVIPSPAKRSRGILGSAGSIKGLRQVVTTSVSSRAQRSGVEGSWVPDARLEKANSGKG